MVSVIALVSCNGRILEGLSTFKLVIRCKYPFTSNGHSNIHSVDTWELVKKV